jgi:hypothetical protein
MYIILMLILLFSIGVAQENYSQLDIAPFVKPNFLIPTTEAIWDVQFSFDVLAASGANGNAGAEFDGTFYYTARWAANLIHKYDQTGVLVEVFSIPGVSGLRDLAFDGVYMYGGNGNSSTIFQMDFNSNTLVGQISTPEIVRHIAYDSDNDAFWIGTWNTAIFLIDRNGTTINSIPAATHGLLGNYGTAYDNWSSGGPYLWVFSQGSQSSGPQNIVQLDVASGTQTGVVHEVKTDFPAAGIGAIAGGLFTATGIVGGTVSIGGILQANPGTDMFFVYELTQVPLQLFFPNGGDTLVVNDTEVILWFSNNGPANVDIEYTIDGGVNWITIATNVNNPSMGSAQYVWSPIPNTPSDNCLVKVSDAIAGGFSDVSDAPFTIYSPFGLTLTSPNGGDTLFAGSNTLIRWFSDVPNDPPDVKLELSTDAGGSWTNIVPSTPNDGEFAWTIVASPSTECLVRVSDAVDGDPFDQSDAPFTILAPDLTLSIPNGGETWLVGSNQDIEWFSAVPNLPPNVKLEYSTNGGTSWKEIVPSTPNDGLHTWTVPNDPSADCYVRVSDDIAGVLSDVSNAPFTIESPASISVSDPATGQAWEVNSTQTIVWNSIGNVGNVNIDISRDNGSSWSTIFANTPNDGSQEWVVQMWSSNQCRIRVSDVQTPSVFGLSGTFMIDPQYVEGGISRGTAQPSGTTQNAYRLFSVPLDLADPRPSAVLEDDLGSYNNTLWRFWDYENYEYVEYPNTRNFTLSRSFFLIVKDAGKVIDTGPGVLVADSLVTVALDTGWNFIANPYNFPIPLSALSITTNLQTYDSDGWVAHTGDLLPWEGYILWSGTPTNLFIRPGVPGSAVLAKNPEIPQIDWTVQIKAQSQDAKDYSNFAGIVEGAADSWDEFDAHEPPHIGEYVSVYFPHQDWDKYPDLYSSDFKPREEVGYSWHFNVESNIQDEISLAFEGLEQVPANFQIRLIDDAFNYMQDLREQNSYTVNNNSENQTHPMRLLVGPPEYIQHSLVGTELISSDFQLFDNFPNPFNPITTIAFSLPQAETVSLKIYNLLGEEVTTIVNRQSYEAGLHSVTWDGRNHVGLVMASGIYLYRVEAGKYIRTKKMLLVK